MTVNSGETEYAEYDLDRDAEEKLLDRFRDPADPLNVLITRRTFGEAYNLIKVHIPRVGDETFALTWKREFNEWQEGGWKQLSYDATPRLMLSFIDEAQLKQLGSGYLLDEGDWDSLRWQPEPTVMADQLFGAASESKRERLIDQAADVIINSLRRYKGLNS